MATSNEERYLKSIDGTLKDILKELKRQGRTETLQVDGKAIARNANYEGPLKFGC